MRVLKWLFHPVNLLIVIVLVALYINRQTLFPELSESPEVKQLVSRFDSVIETLDQGVSQLSGEASAVVPEDDTDAADSGETGIPVNVAEPPQEQAAPVAMADESTAQSSGRYDDLPEMRAVEPDSMAEQSRPLPQSSPDTTDALAPETASADVSSQAARVDGNAKSAVAETGAVGEESPLVIWQAARLAAWNGEAESAIESYRALIALQPANYDAYGEMGNVLLRKGDTEAAAEAYYQAALLLTKSDYPQVAWRVLDIVSRLDQEKASELYQAIRQQQISSAQPRR